MSNPINDIARMDFLLDHFDVINNEWDSISILIAVHELWPSLKAEIERLLHNERINGLSAKEPTE